MEATKKPYKYCIVPLCSSTTLKAPDKLFICVPEQKQRRLDWMKACRRNRDMSEKTTAYVCEDHFNLEEDMENYLKFKLMGGGVKRMKPHVVPHIFDCQPDREIPYPNRPSRAAVVERPKRRIIDEDTASYSPSMTPNPVFNQDDLQTVASIISVSTSEIRLDSNSTVPSLDIIFSLGNRRTTVSIFPQSKPPETKVTRSAWQQFSP